MLRSPQRLFRFKMLDGDVLCRAVMFPRQWRQGVYSPEAALALGRISEGRFAISVGSRYLLKDIEGAHKFGMGTADLANKGLEAREGRPLSPEELQQYVGFYDIFVGAIRGISLEMHRIDILWSPEHNRQEHFEIQVSELPSAKQRTRKDRSAERTRIIGALFARFWGPCMWLEQIEVNGELTPVILPPGTQGGCCAYKVNSVLPFAE